MKEGAYPMEFTNKLINETSPYLLQHAHNPVNWYPWGEEAFEKAANEDKPVLLSIGYSTCHWCHVMAHESFEDIEVARFLNDHFVSIKVDKEERPDVDNVYMTVCQAVTGNGGWPMTLLLTPDQKPFFAATYLPKNTRHGMVGFLDVLAQVEKKWRLEKDHVEEVAQNLVQFIRQPQRSNRHVVPAGALVQNAYASLSASFDEVFGGFGGAPKFPMAHNLLFLFQYYRLHDEDRAREMAEKTLVQMYRGGLFDHIGFGFSRYSTDNKWLVPHFEKMLYDNALLIMAYVEAYSISKEALWREIAEKTIAYITRELGDEGGAFYCGQDADSEGVEGKYYVFNPTEIRNVLGDSLGAAFNKTFDITSKGNFEGESIPNLLESSSLSQDLEEAICMVYNYRKNRYALHVDDKVLSSWNGLMIVALCKAYAAFEDSVYLQKARGIARFIKQNMTDEPLVCTSYRSGKSTCTSFIDDNAFYIWGLLELYRVTADKTYLDEASAIADRTIEGFFDEQEGGFYLYGKSAERLLLRPKETHDGAIPSGNSAMAYNLYRLSREFGLDPYEPVRKRHFEFMKQEAATYPPGHTFFLTTLAFFEQEEASL